ncbi:hypothetical protein G6F53_014284 [Rhizopus delemar]|nr:hypothetical protein G6F53_014284 [Rhizopus delemar]
MQAGGARGLHRQDRRRGHPQETGGRQRRAQRAGGQAGHGGDHGLPPGPRDRAGGRSEPDRARQLRLIASG